MIFAQENQDNNVRDLLSEYWNGYGMVIDEINVSKKQLLRCLTQPELDLLPYQP